MKNSKIDLSVQLRYFKEVAKRCRELENGATPVDVNCGLCRELDSVLDQSTYYQGHNEVLKMAFAAWPKFSGNIIYPVPAVQQGQSPLEAYLVHPNVWVGKYGAMRRRLCGFVANYYEHVARYIESL